MTPFKLILVDPNPRLCDAWHDRFAEFSNVQVVNGYFEQLPEFDCMVSAANSFGLMDGGVDAAITAFFGQALMNRVQQRILDEYLGEQLVGTSMIVETDNDKHPFIAHTPTMRVPKVIAQTDNVYSAMWAMLLAVYRHNQTADRKINIVACPGLGTATGRVPYNKAAYEMAAAYHNYLNRPSKLEWHYVVRRDFDATFKRASHD